MLTECSRIEEGKRTRMSQFMEQTPIHKVMLPNYTSNQFLVSWSRNPQFFQIAEEIIADAEQFYRAEVVI